MFTSQAVIVNITVIKLFKMFNLKALDLINKTNLKNYELKLA